MHEEVAPLGEERFKFGSGIGRNRHAARLFCDVCCQGEQIVFLVRKRIGLLMKRAAQIDALLEVDGASEWLVIGRITRRDAFHAGAGVAMTVGAGLARRACLAVPQRFAIERAQHAGIGGVVVLHRLGVRSHKGVAGPALSLRDFGRNQRTKNDAGREQQGDKKYRRCKLHSTVMLAEAVSEKPLSPIHSKSNFPLLLATVKNEMNGLAAVPGKRSARKISSPSKRQVKLVMMSRGITTPDVVWRKPVSMMCDISVLISMTSPFLAFLGTLIRAAAIRSPPRCRRPRLPRRRPRPTRTNCRRASRSRRSSGCRRAARGGISGRGGRVAPDRSCRGWAADSFR